MIPSHHLLEHPPMKSLIQIAEIAIAALLTGCAAAHQPDSSQPAPPEPKRVTGIGGIFFKCKDPKATRQWYAEHLGLQTDEYGTNFEWRQDEVIAWRDYSPPRRRGAERGAFGHG
jgi:hypothetical protein